MQDVNKTNALLKENGIEYKDIYEHTPQELAAILGVDAVAMGNYDTSKPMSEGASAALGLLIGVYGSTNKGTLNLFIYDGKEGHMAVNYFKTVAGSLFNSPDQLIDKVLRKASRRIPYTKPKN